MCRDSAGPGYCVIPPAYISLLRLRLLLPLLLLLLLLLAPTSPPAPDEANYEYEEHSRGMSINSKSSQRSRGSCRRSEQRQYTTALYAECPSKVVGARGLHPGAFTCTPGLEQVSMQRTFSGFGHLVMEVTGIRPSANDAIIPCRTSGRLLQSVKDVQ